MSIAITINGQVICDINIEEVFSSTIINRSLNRIHHRLEERLLGMSHYFSFTFTCTMDNCFTPSRSHTNCDILHCSTKASHSMTLKMSQNQESAIVAVVRTNRKGLQMISIVNWNLNFTVSIQNIYWGNICETMILHDLVMTLRSRTRTAVCSICITDSAMNHIHQRANQTGLQEVMTTRFTGTDLNHHITRKILSSRNFIVQTDQTLGSNVFREVYLGNLISCRFLRNRTIPFGDPFPLPIIKRCSLIPILVFKRRTSSILDNLDLSNQYSINRSSDPSFMCEFHIWNLFHSRSYNIIYPIRIGGINIKLLTSEIHRQCSQTSIY